MVAASSLSSDVVCEELAGPFGSPDDAEQYVTEPPEDLGDPGDVTILFDGHGWLVYTIAVGSAA